MDLSRNLLQRKFLIFALVGLAVGLAFVLVFILKESNQNVSSPLNPNSAALDKQEEVRPGIPVRLKIPKLNVDSAIEHVGLTPQGDVDVPKGANNAGWFNRWPRPGEKGSSVIVGHYGWRDNVPAVFDNLHKLQQGDRIYVKDKKGLTTTFEVRKSRKYDPEARAEDVFRSNDGGAHLNLITCEGDWNKEQNSYSKRLVVFTDKL
jgi:LPXTG-site transpeptidase (sortase) family protein